MRELQDKAAATPLSAPRRKMLGARFWALILLAAGTDFHYKDIISIAVRTPKQKISKHPPRPSFPAGAQCEAPAVMGF